MVGTLGKIAAFFSSNTSLHSSCNNNNNNKELRKAANAAQLAIKRRNRRNEWMYGEAGVPQGAKEASGRRATLSLAGGRSGDMPGTMPGTPIGGSSEDVHAIRSKFSRKNPVWSSLRDLRSSRRTPPACPPPVCSPPADIIRRPAPPLVASVAASLVAPSDPAPPPTEPVTPAEVVELPHSPSLDLNHRRPTSVQEQANGEMLTRNLPAPPRKPTCPLAEAPPLRPATRRLEPVSKRSG